MYAVFSLIFWEADGATNSDRFAQNGASTHQLTFLAALRHYQPELNDSVPYASVSLQDLGGGGDQRELHMQSAAGVLERLLQSVAGCRAVFR